MLFTLSKEKEKEKRSGLLGESVFPKELLIYLRIQSFGIKPTMNRELDSDNYITDLTSLGLDT